MIKFHSNITYQYLRSIALVVWDLPLRIYHWLLVIFVFGAFITSEWNDRSVHEVFGMEVLGLCIFRIIWGFVGSPSAQFKNFIKPPSKIIAYLKQMLKRKSKSIAGHSPVGGLATIVLISITSWFAVTGSISNDGILFEGPFAYLFPSVSQLATKLHQNAEILLILIVMVHLSAITFYRLLLGQNLIPAMFHGSRDEKEGPGGRISTPHTVAGLGLLSLCLAGAYLAIMLKPSIL